MARVQGKAKAGSSSGSPTGAAASKSAKAGGSSSSTLAKAKAKSSVAAIKKNLNKVKSPAAGGSSRGAAAGSSAGSSSRGSAVSASSLKSDANLLKNVCRLATEVVGPALDRKQVCGLAVKGAVAEGVARMLAKDYGVDSPKSLALALVLMADPTLLTDAFQMKRLGLKALTEGQLETVKVYQELLAGELADHEAVAKLATSTSKGAEGLPKHSQVALLGWMVVVAAKLSGIRPARVQRLPTGKLEGMTPLEKRKRMGTFQLLGEQLVQGGRLASDEAACKKLLADLAQIVSKF